MIYIYINLSSHIFYDIKICKSQALGMSNNWVVPHLSPDSTGRGWDILSSRFRSNVLKTTKLFWWIWVFPKIGVPQNG